MGKAQSTEVGGKTTTTTTASNKPTDNRTKDANGGVQMRADKGGGGKKPKQTRPMSYPGPSSADNAVSSAAEPTTTTTTTAADAIPIFNRASHNPSLTGRRPSQVFDQNFTLSPISELPTDQYPADKSPVPVIPTTDPRTSPSNSAPTDAGKAVNVQDPSTSTKSPTRPIRTMRDGTTQTFRHSNQKREEIGRAIDRLIIAFPKYKDLRYISVDAMDSGAVETLRDFCVKIVDYRSDVEVATQRHMERMAALEEHCAGQDERLKWQDAEIVRLNERVSSLSSPQQDPGYTSAGSDDDGGKSNASQSQSQRNATKLSDDSVDLDDSARFRPRGAGREGIYKATPLVIAEGDEGSKAVVKRTGSLKPVGLEQQRNAGYERPMSALHDEDPLPPDADADEKLKWLERSLERERRENLYLRDRLKAKGGVDTPESIYEVLLKRKGIDKETMVHRYRRLEEHAIGRLYASIKRHMAAVSDKRRSQFICAVIETSYTVALSSILHFPDIIHGLLMDPVQAFSQKTEGSGRNNPAAKPVRERNRPGQRTGESSQSGDLHEALVKQLITYLQQMADVTDLTSLAENVCDGLRRNYSDCFSSALLNQTDFKQFLGDCCRLAWQMAMTTPPFYLSTDSLRMDDRIHETLMQDEVTNAQVDHYLWPTLFEHRNGDVLYKGRVVIRTMAVSL